MPLNLEQYARWLDGRGDLLWPGPPQIVAPKAKPHLKRLPDIRVVSFNVYGTLLSLTGGELYFVHPEKFIMQAALEKTIQEFKMWQSMSRKPGKPSEYMGRMYEQLLEEVRIARGSGNERYPEVRADEVWERVVKRLIKNEYTYDTAFYGSVEQLCEKISYFFHTSLQGVGAQSGALGALTALKQKGMQLGLIADGQCFTRLHLQRALAKQGKAPSLDELFDPALQVLSFESGARRPSERLFRTFLNQLIERDISPRQVLHVGAHVPHDIGPAKRLGFRTALYAGDQSSVVASNEQLNEKGSRPDVLVTELGQLVSIVSA